MRGRDVTVLSLGAVVLVVLLLALLGGGMMGPGMMGAYGYGPWWGIAMGLFWVLILAGGGLLLIALLRRDQTPDTGIGQVGSRAMDILRERYAKGEITREEYEQMRRDLADDS